MSNGHDPSAADLVEPNWKPPRKPKKPRQPLQRKTRLNPRRQGPQSVEESDADYRWRQEIGQRWGTRCIICGRPAEPAHCLPKGSHPEYRIEPWNGLPRCEFHHRGPMGEHNIGDLAPRIQEFWMDIGRQLQKAETGERKPMTVGEIRTDWRAFEDGLTGRHTSPMGPSD